MRMYGDLVKRVWTMKSYIPYGEIYCIRKYKTSKLHVTILSSQVIEYTFGVCYVQISETVCGMRFLVFKRNIMFHFIRSTFNCNEMKKKILFGPLKAVFYWWKMLHWKNRIGWLILYTYVNSIRPSNRNRLRLKFIFFAVHCNSADVSVTPVSCYMKCHFITTCNIYGRLLVSTIIIACRHVSGRFSRFLYIVGKIQYLQMDKTKNIKDKIVKYKK